VTTIPLAPRLLAGSSDLPGGFGRTALITPPYLVLLRAGFGLPLALPRARCALTAPFHPYPDVLGRCIFCATFRQVTLPGRYPARCPLEFGLSSPSGTSRREPRFPDATAVRPTATGAIMTLRGRPQPRLWPNMLVAAGSLLPLSSRSMGWSRTHGGPPQPSVFCLIWYCSSFLYKLLRGVSMTSAVFEIFQPFSRSLRTRKSRSAASLNARSVASPSAALG
jgi:hypothetical protein